MLNYNVKKLIGMRYDLGRMRYFILFNFFGAVWGVAV